MRRHRLLFLLEQTALAVVLAVTAAASLRLQSEYAYALYLGLPAVGGALAATLAARRGPLGHAAVVGVVLLQQVLTAAAVILMRIDGLACITMALPLTFPVSFAGGFWASVCLRNRCGPGASATRARSFALLPLVWLALAAEPHLLPEPELREVTSSVEIDADADTVWRELLGFSEIDAPRGWLFRVGIASPESARLDGEGVGAVRHCVFSTGTFVEPVTHWEPGRKLAFDVVEQPVPMTETSVWPDIDPPHLHDCFVSERGQFLIEPLDDGRVRLSGTTWYRQRMWPQAYWGCLSDHIVHTVHERVLQHIQQEAERRT